MGLLFAAMAAVRKADRSKRHVATRIAATRLTDNQYELLLLLAASSGVTVSEQIRDLIERAALVASDPNHHELALEPAM